MKRFFRGICTFTCSLSLMGAIVGCQNQNAVKSTPSIESSTPMAAAEKRPEQMPATESKPKETAPIEAAKSEPAAKPIQTSKPVQTATPIQTAKPASSAPPVVPQSSVTVETKQAVEPVKQQSVMLSITGDAGKILERFAVVWEEGDSVLDVLKKATKEKKIQMEYRGSGAVAYVEGIDNLYEMDHGPKSGWMYRVNGIWGKRSAGDVVLKPNDKIEWLYTLELGKDLE